MSKNNTIVLQSEKVKKQIAKEVAKQQSYLIGHFSKTSVPDLVVPQWAAVSLSSPEFLKYLGKEFAKLIDKDSNLLCGIETAGIALAGATSIASDLPWIYARKERKTSGGREAFEGTYHKGDKLTFIDNFSATGKGLIDIMKHAREDGMSFEKLLVIVDNEWPKADEFNQNITTHALITNRELTYYLNEISYFPGDLYKYCQMYLDEPEKLKSGSPDSDNFIKELAQAPDLPYIKKSN